MWLRSKASMKISLEELSKIKLEQQSRFNLKYEMGVYRTTNPDIPEEAVCYDESFILGLYEKYGLRIKGPIIMEPGAGEENTSQCKMLLSPQRCKRCGQHLEGADTVGRFDRTVLRTNASADKWAHAFF